MRHVIGTVVSYDTVGSTVNGNPIYDVVIRRTDDTTSVSRVMHDAAVTYDIPNLVNLPRADQVQAFELTDAGRIRGIDVYARSAARRLLDAFPRGATVSTMVTHVSSSGMSRHIAILAGNADGTVDNVSGAVARVLGWKLNRRGDAVVVTGTGMDMAFHTVYTLAGKLYGDGNALIRHAV